MKIQATAALVAAGFLLSACATIVDGKTSTVSVNSTPDGAKCEMRNSQGTYYVTTPGTVLVPKSKTDLFITCRKDGFQDSTQTVQSDFKSTTIGNVIAGGVIGIGVDAASGAMYDYPSTVVLTMHPTTPAVQPASMVTAPGT